MIVVFICNKYSPAHIYSIKAYSAIFKKNYIDCFLLDDFILDKTKFDKDNIDFVSLESETLKKNDVVFFFVSPNINNSKTFKKIKRILPSSKSIYLYHEPITRGVAKELIKDRGFTFKTIKYIFGLFTFNGYSLCKRFDHIILPSKNAEMIFEESKKFKKLSHSVIHLLFNNNENCLNFEREYFSYIGTIANNHGFYEFVNYLLKHDLKYRQKILIATSSKLEASLIESLKAKYGDRIKIHQGSFMTDEFINQLYRKTSVLWLGYKHSAQSGVLPMAFMNGTPIICSDIPSFKEFAINNYNCEYVDIFNYESIDNGIDAISSSFSKYQANCIETYNKFFNPNKKEGIVLELFNKISKR